MANNWTMHEVPALRLQSINLKVLMAVKVGQQLYLVWNNHFPSEMVKVLSIDRKWVHVTVVY